jgi:branched-chain amino acid transport system permease protein
VLATSVGWDAGALAPLQAALERTGARVRRRNDMAYFLELSINGAVAGSLYALVALAFVVVYKASKVINFALGELVMLATALVGYAMVTFGLGLGPAMVFAGLMMALVAATFNQLVLKRLVGHRLIALLMITIGFGALLRAATALTFQGVPRKFDLALPEDPIFLGPVLVSPHEIIVAMIAAGVVIAVALFFQKSRTGVALRAIADDQQAALGMGVNVQRQFTFAWALAGAITVVGGVLWTYLTGGGFSMVLVGLKVFPIVIIGGLDSIPGVIIGAMLIGLLESLAAGYLDSYVGGGISNVAAFVVLIGMLLLRPYGFFGKQDIERV